MSALNTREPDPAGPDALEPDPLARFRSWRGFLFASLAVNVLFVYGMLGGMADPGVATWYKALVWLPFNVIATAIYLAILGRLSRADANRSRAGTAFYLVLCVALIVANWAVLLAA